MPEEKRGSAGAPVRRKGVARGIRDGLQSARRTVLAAGAVAALVVFGVLAVVVQRAHEHGSGPAVDAATDARQRELTAQGAAERNPLKAIVLFDQAVTLAPRAPGARDALLGRAARFLDVKDVDAAAADINALRLRRDIGPVEGKLDALIARLRQMRP